MTTDDRMKKIDWKFPGKPAKPVLDIPEDVAVEINKVFGKRHHLLPKVHGMVHSQQTTWDAIRCAVHNIESGFLHTVHIRPIGWNKDGEEAILAKGGCTIVFAIPPRRGNMVTVAVVWCNETDTFNPKLGRLLAAHNYIHHHTIQIRLPEKGRYSSQIKNIFSLMVQGFDNLSD